MRLFELLFGQPSKGDKKMCRNKRRYANEPAAKAALQRINPYRMNDRPTRSYKCPLCNGYHLTRQQR